MKIDNEIDGNTVMIDLHIRLGTFDEFHKEINFDILVYGEDEGIKIGDGKGYILPYMDTKEELVELADEIDEQCYISCNNFNPDKIQEFYYNIVVIRSIEIDKPYRGKGYGLKAMNLLIQHFETSVILLNPHPIHKSCSKSKINKGIEQLQKHWSKCGFKQFEGTETFYRECCLLQE